jgi:hypothetical protein
LKSENEFENLPKKQKNKKNKKALEEVPLTLRERYDSKEHGLFDQITEEKNEDV